MSLIGPRPHALNFAKHYAAVHPKYYDRHRVRPGLACIVEVTALHYLTEQDKHIKLRVDCDLYYVRHQSFLMDARICIKLARYVLRSLMASLAHAKPHLKKHLHSKAQDVLQAPVFDAKAHTPEVQHAFVARPRKH
jgi:lipopolysaccharide/colanic/teichoic acid biosynthesis glycosyltransferase